MPQQTRAPLWGALSYPFVTGLDCDFRSAEIYCVGTGVLYLDGFESLVIGTKKEHPCGVLFPTLS